MWRWFRELDNARGHNGWGPNPISYLDVMAWMLTTGTIVRPREVEVIMLIDRVVSSERAKAATKTNATTKPASANRRKR